MHDSISLIIKAWFTLSVSRRPARSQLMVSLRSAHGLRKYSAVLFKLHRPLPIRALNPSARIHVDTASLIQRITGSWLERDCCQNITDARGCKGPHGARRYHQVYSTMVRYDAFRHTALATNDLSCSRITE
jgi:hypothetical protein